MKVIAQGKLPPSTATHWWIDQTVECPRCKFKGRLDASDIDKIAVFRDHERDGMAIAAHIELVCPTPGCRAVIWCYEPGKPIPR
jgi:hypothetical protein